MPGLLEQGQQRWALYLWDMWTSGNWHTQSDEERRYALNHMVEHFDDVGIPDQTAFTLASKEWMTAWAAYDNSYAGFVADVNRIWLRAEAAGDLVMQVKCALCFSGIASFSAAVSATLLPLVLEYGLVTPEQALATARAKDDQQDRAEILVAIIPQLPMALLPSVLDAAETLTEDYHHDNRRTVLAAVFGRAPLSLHRRILELIGSMDDGREKPKAICEIAGQIDPVLLDEMVEIARGLSRPGWRVEALEGLALAHPESARTRLLSEAYESALRISLDEQRTDALIRLVKLATGELRAKVYDEAFQAARTIEEIAFDTREPADHRASALFELLPLAPIEQRDRVISELLEAVASQPPGQQGPTTYQENSFARLERELGPSYLARVREMIAQRDIEPAEPHDVVVHDPVTSYGSGSDEYDRVRNELNHMSRGTDPKRLAELVQSAETLSSIELLSTAAAKADEPLLTEILVKLCRSAEEQGTRYGAGDLGKVAQEVLALPGDRTADALRIARAVVAGPERAQALATISTHLPRALRVPILREALDTARSVNVTEARQKLLDELSPGAVDFAGVASDAIMRAGFIPDELDLGVEFGPDDDSEDDAPENERESEPNMDVDAADQLANIRAEQRRSDPDYWGKRAYQQMEIIEQLASALTVPLLEEALKITADIEVDDAKRRALESLLPYIPDNLWHLAAEAAERVVDSDESGEAWIAIATQTPDKALARHAAEQGLESIREAENEDDYPEPLLRMAGVTPDDLLPVVLDVATDLYVVNEPERRANAFKGLAWRLENWCSYQPALAMESWSTVLRKLADRPLSTFLEDFAGFNYFARILAGPDHDQLLVAGLRDVVSDVCSWWDTSASASGTS